MNELLALLDNLNIKYDIQTHPAIVTIEEAKQIVYHIEGIGTKSLFLKDKKHNYYLVVTQEDKRTDLKKLKEVLGCGNLSFAHEEDLKKILNLESGGITACGVINDKEGLVKCVVLDDSLKDSKILVHPNVLTATMSIEFNDLLKLLDSVNHQYMLIEMK